MAFINIEIKARTQRHATIRNYLLKNGAAFIGIDHQKDTYYCVPKGRLKLRQGKIENSLIYYDRKNDIGPKQSDFNVVAVTDGELLNALLTTSLGVVTVVVKEREIYFLKNVKFHLDTLQDLGCFVEIEASNKYADLQIETLRKQCEFYMQQLFIHDDDLIHVSYSDMLMA